MRLNPDVLHRIRLELAGRMLEAANTLKGRLQIEVDTPYPRASRPGEYPRRRTGTGQREIFVIPDTPEGIVAHAAAEAAPLDVFVGFSNHAWYMPYLERERGRLGLFSLFAEMQPLLRAIIAGRGTRL
jgi:hypothetical protein